jgi:1,4-alpha-glucan branching enzyme
VDFEVSLPGRHPQSVTLAGDFNGWSPRGLDLVRDGSSDRWRITLELPPGRHVYSFVVDGTTWVIDPRAPRIDTDDLGPANVVAVGQAGD